MSQPGENALVAGFVRHANGANLLMALLVLFGLYGMARINTQFFPTVETNRISVAVVWAGASADDVAGNILDVLEPELRFLDSIDEVTSFAREGSASIRLEFTEGADMRKALSDVEQAVAGVTTLPVDAEAPVVTRSEFYENVGKVIVRGPFDEPALKHFARQVRDQLLAAGIDRVEFEGLRDSEFVADVPVLDLRRLDLTVGDIAARVAGDSRDSPSGALEGGFERQVRTLGDAESPAAIGQIAIVAMPGGEQVRLRDIAQVREQVDDDAPRGLSRGETAIELSVRRTADADTLAMAAIMEAALAQARETLPASVALEVYDVSAGRVQERIGLLVKNGLTGLLIVVAVLFVFLNARIALWVAAGVPVALLATVGLMYMSGQSINMISLFALIMTLGIIVDDAIVVGEHTATRLAAGDPPDLAAINGAGRMITPVAAAMLTTAAAFAPILLIGDTIGQIMGALPLVAVAVLIASLIECFLILPGHLSHSLGGSPPRARAVSPLRIALAGAAVVVPVVLLTRAEGLATGMGLGAIHASLAAFADALGRGYALALIAAGGAFGWWLEWRRVRRLARPADTRAARLDWRNRFDAGFERLRDGPVHALSTAAVRWRYVTVAVCVASVVLSMGLLRGGRIPFVFFPSPEAEHIIASVTFQSGLSEQRTLEAMARIGEALTRAESELTGDSGERLVNTAFATIGKSGDNRSDSAASITVELTSSEVRSVRTPAIARGWQQALPPIPGVKRVAVKERRGGPPGRDLDIRLKDASPEVLKAAALELQRVLGGFPGVSGVDDDLPFGKPELGVALTDRGRALGFDASRVGEQLRDVVEGRIARRIALPDEEVKVRIRQAGLDSGGALRALDLRSPTGEYVPLEEVATIHETQGFALIQRRDGETVVSVTADVNPSITSNAAIIEALRDGPLACLSRARDAEDAFRAKSSIGGSIDETNRARYANPP